MVTLVTEPEAPPSFAGSASVPEATERPSLLTVRPVSLSSTLARFSVNWLTLALNCPAVLMLPMRLMSWLLPGSRICNWPLRLNV